MAVQRIAGVAADPVLRLLEAFQELGRSLDAGRTVDTALAGVQLVLPEADRATLTVLSLDGKRVVCRRCRGRDIVHCDVEPGGLAPAPSSGIAHRIFSTGEPVLLPVLDPLDEAAFETGEGTASLAGVPLLGAGGRRLGALIAESATLGALDEERLQIMRSYAAGVAPAIERVLFYELAVEGRKLVSELEVAARVLKDLLPNEAPLIPGLDVAGVYEPCSQVGGDYYDFVPLGDDRWGVAMADVAGKGVPAALLVGTLHASVFSLALSHLALRAIFARTNRMLYESSSETRYATLFYGVLDAPLRRIVHVNAGHPPPLLARANGQVECIHASGLPVGLFPGPRYFEQDTQLRDGDLLLLYTDGITETTGRSGEPFGRERLASLLRSERDLGNSAADVCDNVLKAARRFRAGAPEDDATVVAIRAG